MLDLIIIGGAAVGSSAAIYAARRRLEFKMITLDLGGEVALSGEVANWPGIISTQGFELAQQFTKHVKSYNVDIEEGWKVVSITSQKNYHIVTAENAKSEQKTYETKTNNKQQQRHQHVRNNKIRKIANQKNKRKKAKTEAKKKKKKKTRRKNK
jgi:thioredoxin reductase